MTQNDKKKICCAPYLSNHTSYDLHLWYISVKWWYSQAFFSFFSILLLQVVSGVKVQKWPKMTTNSVCGTPSLRNHISYDFHLRYTFVKWYLQAFFHFCKNLIFWVVSGLKSKKWSKMKKNYVYHTSSQEACIIWLSFLEHMFKMMTSPDVFFIFSKFWFSGLFKG